ncbi:hypothetical protein N7495_006329 [Penicillium taxi]|uniref:uncharacterized protein n=1 Tax=Penicillium taxi TaxID=168475 RepID=UPI0025450D02|nr:uncharacterized protein N7495_006329 [Penicillium taxi]KAJ5894638.1 hypothetical protein N7495_006329 [Penicillium taxi]
MLSRYLVGFLLAASALASPKYTYKRAIEKRASPKVEGYTKRETSQIHDAFGDAMKIAKSVLTTKADIVDPIFNKYFLPSHRKDVFDVFEKITGGESAGYSGNSILNQMTIVADYEKDGEYACDGSADAELRDWETKSPKLVLCEYGFLYGGIDKGYPKFGDEPEVDSITCSSIRKSGNKIYSLEDVGGASIE